MKTDLYNELFNPIEKLRTSDDIKVRKDAKHEMNRQRINHINIRKQRHCNIDAIEEEEKNS
jgi:hypothetical protein